MVCTARWADGQQHMHPKCWSAGLLLPGGSRRLGFLLSFLFSSSVLFQRNPFIPTKSELSNFSSPPLLAF